MSSSPFDPYQSRFVRSILRQTRRWLERGQETVRQIQVATSWSVQVLLYPVYALFQATRMVGEQIGRTVQTQLPKLGFESSDRYEIPLQPASTVLTADTPIQHVLQTVQRFSMPISVPVFVGSSNSSIRAIASSLDTRSLVLVTNHNQTLDILTLEQQRLLHQRMIWDIANYGRNAHLWRLPQRVATKLIQAVRSRFPALRPTEQGTPLRPLLPDVLNADMPIRRSLLTVQQFLASTELPALQAQPQLPTETLVIESSLQPAPAIFIRGVASLLTTKSLVLVTNQNQLLDVLNSDQQQHIHQRIIWEVAHYLRYLRIRQQLIGLTPLRIPSDRSQLWPPIRAFHRLMAWMQSGPIAIATNLFQEASLPASPAPVASLTAASPPLVLSAAPVTKFNWLRHRLIAALNSSSRAAIAQSAGGTTQSTQSPYFLATTSAASLSALELGISLPTSTVQGDGTVSPMSSDGGRSPHYIDTDVTFMGYEQSVLERVLRWLDRCLLWIEEWLLALWNTLLKLGTPKQ